MSSGRDIFAGELTPNDLGHRINIITAEGAEIADVLDAFKAARSLPVAGAKPVVRVWLRNTSPNQAWTASEGGFEIGLDSPINVYEKVEDAA